MNKKDEIALKILKIFGMGVFFTAVSLLAPQFPYLMLKGYLRKKFNTDYKARQLRNSLYYLKRKKFIAYEKYKFKITKLGLEYLDKTAALDVTIKKVPWDNKWRIVSFDIPENLKPSRHVFRLKLQELGFYHFQRSVFILPFPCERELQILANALQIDNFVFIFTTERFKHDKKIVKQFKL